MFKNAHVVFTFNKTFNRMRVKDTGGWWRIVIDYAAKSAKFCTGEGERGAIPTSASKLLEFRSLCAFLTANLPSVFDLLGDGWKPTLASNFKLLKNSKLQNPAEAVSVNQNSHSTQRTLRNNSATTGDDEVRNPSG